jgi:EmrB/QacA subfamily drug resistance transporter
MIETRVVSGDIYYQRRWLGLLILSLSLTLVIMDATIVNVTIPSIVKDFDATFREVEWVNTIYSLVYASTLILWGKIGDQYGRRLLFVLGVILFGLGSALVGASSSVGMMVAMRALQGIGAAMLSPSTLSIVTTTFKGKERGIAFGIWGATAGVAAALGPLVGGYLTDHTSWRWAFYINIPIAIAAGIGSFWAIGESRDEHSRRYFDFPGLLLGGFGLAALVFGIIEGQDYGWWKPDAQFSLFGWDWPSKDLSFVPVSILLGLMLLVVFTIYERRLERRGLEPLFEFGLIRFTSYRYGMLTGLIVNLGEIGVLFAASLYLQGTKGLSAFDTGVALLPLAVMAFFGAPAAGAFSNKIGPKWIVTAGMVIEVIALGILSAVITPDVSVTTVALLLGVYGLGLGLAIAQLTSLVLFDIPGPKAGIASGGNSTIRQVGAALGIAIIGTVLTSVIKTEMQDRIDTNSVLSGPQYSYAETGFIEIAKQPAYFEEAELAEALTTEFSSQIASAMGLEPAAAQQIAQPLANAAAPELLPMFNESRSRAMSSSALAAAIFIALGAASSLMLPNPGGAARRHTTQRVQDTI